MQKNEVGLQLNETQLLTYTDDMVLLGGSKAYKKC